MLVSPFVGETIFIPVILQRRKHEVTSLRAVFDGVRAQGMGQETGSIACLRVARKQA